MADGCVDRVVHAAQGVPASTDVVPVSRGRALEIVDAQGRVRASLSILPAEAGAQQTAYPETTILRLMNTKGRPAIKVATSDEGSGMSLTGGADSRGTYVTPGSSGTTSQVKIKNEDGREQLLKP
jgi:hypothetical protein